MVSRRKEGNFSFLIGVFVIFTCLKMLGLVDWSWWFVTSPIWVPFAAFPLLVSCFVILAFAFGIQINTDRK